MALMVWRKCFITEIDSINTRHKGLIDGISVGGKPGAGTTIAVIQPIASPQVNAGGGAT